MPKGALHCHPLAAQLVIEELLLGVQPASIWLHEEQVDWIPDTQLGNGQPTQTHSGGTRGELPSVPHVQEIRVPECAGIVHAA